jgi:hypothetical protein
MQRTIDPETHKSNSLLNVVRRISRLKVTRGDYAVKRNLNYKLYLFESLILQEHCLFVCWKYKYGVWPISEKCGSSLFLGFASFPLHLS